MTAYCRTRTALLVVGTFCAHAHAAPLTSPDRHIAVDVTVSPTGTLTYAVTRDGKPVILPSGLGIEVRGADLTQGLTLAASSPVKPIEDRYELATAKKRHITYRANEQTHTVRNAQGQAMDVTFRVSNDGVAFRYRVAGKNLKFVRETTGFAFDKSTKAWLQPMAVAQTGWSNTNPSYEEHYQREIPVGTPSTLGAGWVFPALFRTGETWVALTEANLDGSFHASRLHTDSRGGVYRLDIPAAPEVFTNGALLAESKGDLITPWRIVALGSLRTLVESTLGTDLAAPAIAFDKAKIQPGHASWSWALLKDDGTYIETQKRFVDYAADMHWDYTLVDADWDRKIGFERLRELVDYAAAKKIGILVWYNSSGAWNKTPYSPKGALLTRAARVREFARLREMGVKGVKVDFFAGDGKSMVAYYVDMLQDAADAGLLVNFHGATLPRGWSRTFPNLMTVEAVKGFEFTTFDQKDQDAMPPHAAMLPFSRNLFDPMDYTPLAFGDIPKIKRVTRNGFELAETVLFLSGIQHFAERPEGMAGVPEYVKNLLRDLPRSWDDVRLIDGYPARHAVIARKSGDSWYVAGFNADTEARNVDLDLSFIEGRSGILTTDGDGERAFSQAPIRAGKTSISIKPRGGFVAVFK
ncbi:glycoside hydrolase family 97 catalytic domain-containing protein [Massilia sp. CFBP9012]|uniref:glycoside hydrolase family 97 protein n=1 Tax=Massilia sp. CFBP9012 TaxID=3096531 RepID=UPI002A69DDB8|nr:glycoside hydrolase family 97 catalytic domain-containing protein [Massilia sp. CFBP9012]MDY0974847.1 glycoside hydrolase family 97 catalytic domain-containing protein [Massilia sp. CFBP9012]